jgi:hypothetical protein
MNPRYLLREEGVVMNIAISVKGLYVSYFGNEALKMSVLQQMRVTW